MIKYLETISTNKAKSDIDLFCKEEGYQNIATCFNNNSKILKFIGKFLTVLLLPFKLKKDDILIIQYPYKKFYKIICILTHIKSAYSITLIHDLGAFRRKKITAENENKRLQHTDAIISHNFKMTKWLKDHKCKTPIVNLDIFDYHSSESLPIETKRIYDNRIVYAGALGPRKNKFLYSLHTISNLCKFRICGNGLDTNLMHSMTNIEYSGFVKSDDFISSPEADWGLVWDGDSINECNGEWGTYLKYNNPHKASFYIRAGLPIIVWKDSAMSDFIESNAIGVSVKSLTELPYKLSQIDDDKYNIIRNNVNKFAKDLSNGYFFKRALNQAINTINAKRNEKTI